MFLQISSVLARKDEESAYFLEQATREGKLSGVLHDSVIKADVIQSVPPNVVDQRIGRVFDSTVKIMEEKMKVVLGLK